MILPMAANGEQIKMRDEQPLSHGKTVVLLYTALENYSFPLGAAPEASFHALWQQQVLAPSITTYLEIAFFLRLLLVQETKSAHLESRL